MDTGSGTPASDLGAASPAPTRAPTGARTRRRAIGLGVLGLCALVTLAAAVVALVRGGDGTAADGSAGFRVGPWGGDAVALVKLDGAITDAMVEPRRERAGRENVYGQLRRAQRDAAVKAVVLRINSPGGSAAASKALYDQVRRIRADGKPVVVHFADVAASGGYYVGAAGDRIVSQPAAITGSIGVILVAPDLRGLYDKIGYRERVFKTGPYKDLLSASRDVTPEERAILEKLLGDTLDQFVRVVAEGRNLPEADVRRVADGRVFSGTEALNLRLVDEVGDQHRAIRLAGELAGLRGEPRVVLYEAPRQGGLLGLLVAALLGGDRLEHLDRLLPAHGSASVRYEWRG